ncbi:MAG: TRAP transporter large permease subunit [Clostridiales bacterium]|nr:TRAP transporter large permease subunit [Clostridiales bacterium]
MQQKFTNKLLWLLTKRNTNDNIFHVWNRYYNLLRVKGVINMESLLYLGIMLAVICVWFLAFKRPVYEAVLLAFVVLLFVTNTWGNVLGYINEGLSTSLLYSMVAFVAMSILLTKTKIVDSCIAVILSLIGRIRGGAGYTAVIASAFMGALSGSGPGNVMATGSLTIPAMKRSGFPAELAANIESNASYLGNMIPPSSNIVAAMAAFSTFAAGAGIADVSQGQFWIVLWAIALWFVAQRVIMVWAFCKHYKVQPMSKEELPDLKATFKAGWQALLLPVIILLPFVLDALFANTFFVARLGTTGAKYLSKSVLLFVGGISSIYACLIVKDKSTITPNKLARMFADGVKSISPAIGVCVFGYMIGAMFDDLGVAESLGTVISAWNFGKLGMVLAICVITCVMGMVVPGSSQVVIFGPVFITLLANVGVNPLVAAAMLPCICGVMCGITPPLGLGMYAGMTIAQSDFSKTFKNNLWWVAAQFIMQVAVLMGWLPLFGL